LNVSLNTLRDILEMIVPANQLTGAKHSAFSTNHLADSNKTKHNNYSQIKHKNLDKHR